MSVRIGSICSGVDGLALGLERAGVGHTIWHAEIDPHASVVLAARWPGIPNHGDLKTAEWERVEPCDILVGGYPCQPFSSAGQRKGALDERHLWPHVYAALRVLRPRLALFENVAGHVSLGLDAVLRDLAEAGFDAEWGTVRASDVGAPHRRERLFILATNTDCGRLEGGTKLNGEAQQAPADGCPHRGHPDRHREPVADPENVRREWGGATRGWRDGSQNDGEALADPDGERHAEARRTTALEATGAHNPADGRDGTPAPVWGTYEPAIRRWERLTRPAPAPTDAKGRLSPKFVEWMQGFEDGFVTDLVGRTAALKCLGNAVVPQVSQWVGAQIVDGAA